MIDEMTALREAWADVQPPSPDAQNRARAALLARAVHAGPAPAEVGAALRPMRSRNRRWSGWGWRSGIAVLAAAAVVGGLVLTANIGQQKVKPANIEAIDLAAEYAAAQPFTAPRPDQWIYLEARIVNPGKIAQVKGLQTDVTAQFWTRADGKQMANIDGGKLVTTPENMQGESFPPLDYATLAGLPTDPEELLSWARGYQSPFADTPELKDSMAFNAIATILERNILPPAVTAALLRTLPLIPGVVQASEPVEIDGRAAIAVGRVQEGWLRQDILLDPDTHEFIGSREIAIADHTSVFGPEGAQPGGTDDGQGPPPGAAVSGGGTASGGETVQVPNGEIQSMSVRTAIRIVDAPGATS